MKEELSRIIHWKTRELQQRFQWRQALCSKCRWQQLGHLKKVVECSTVTLPVPIETQWESTRHTYTTSVPRESNKQNILREEKEKERERKREKEGDKRWELQFHWFRHFSCCCGFLLFFLFFFVLCVCVCVCVCVGKSCCCCCWLSFGSVLVLLLFWFLACFEFAFAFCFAVCLFAVSCFVGVGFFVSV